MWRYGWDVYYQALLITSTRKQPAGRAADLLIAEAYCYERKVRFHLGSATLREKLLMFGAKRVILTHMSPDMLGRVSELRDCEAANEGLVRNGTCSFYFWIANGRSRKYRFTRAQGSERAILAVCARDAGQRTRKKYGCGVKRSPTAAAPIMEGYQPGQNQGWTQAHFLARKNSDGTPAGKQKSGGRKAMT
jgi:hypothetical protein